jgi:hypothetical protein
VYAFRAGTTTPLATYADANGTPNSQPVVLDATGSAEIWIGSASYKFQVLDANGIQIELVDNVSNSPVSLLTMVFSSTPTFDASAASDFEFPLTGNVTASTLTGLQAGQTINVRLIQDATGGRTFAWPSNVRNAGDVDLTANASTSQSFKVGSDLIARATSAPMVS